MGFRIGLLYTRFASMPQALGAALREDGHEVIRPEYLHIRTQACGGNRGPYSLSWAILTGAPRWGFDHGPGRAGDQARGTPLCWGGAATHRPVGVSAQVLGEAWTRLSAGTGSGSCSRGGRW